MGNISNLKNKGLYTFQNFLSAIPEGALLDATNVIIDRDGIIEPRRGIAAYGNIGLIADRAKQLISYKGRVLAHYNNVMAYDNGTGTFTNFLETFNEVQAGLRIKAIELNGNCYVTTDKGIKKISSANSTLSTAAVSPAGGVKALDGQGVVDYTSVGFFTGLSKVAYRIVWTVKDVNNNEIQGSPSSRIVVTNYSEATGNVRLTFQVPAEITTSYYYQVYRTALGTAPNLAFLNDLDPGNEMRLVYQANITTLTNEITILDQQPDALQRGGAFLYTNSNTGEGILQANEPPPIAKDIAIFKNSAFYGNIQQRHALDITLLGVQNLKTGVITAASVSATTLTITSNLHGLSNGNKVVVTIPNSTPGSFAVDAVYVVSGVMPNTFNVTVPLGTVVTDVKGAKFFASYVTVASGASSTDYFFVGNAESNKLTFGTQAATLAGSYFLIRSADNAVTYLVWFDTTGTAVAPIVSGAVRIRVDISPKIKATKIIQDLTYTADTAGVAGNDITIEYASGGTAGAETVAVAGKAIKVTIAPGVSTATQIKTAVDANITAASLVDVTITGSGAATQGAVSATPLFGGEDGLATTDNIAETVKNAIAAATTDFLFTLASPDLTLTNANTGPADAVTISAPPPGFSNIKLQDGYAEDVNKRFVRLSGFASPGQAIDDTARSLIHIINANTTEVIYGYYLSSSEENPGAIHFERRDNSSVAFSLTANNLTTGSAFNPDLTTTATSINEKFPNRIVFSKPQQPEATPLVNYIDIGSKDQEILRIVALRDSLFIFKNDGIYRLTGTDSTNFSVVLFDNSIELIAPDSCGVLNNEIYCLTDGGVATVTETGVGIISRPIENEFLRISTHNFPTFSTATFGFGYETERAYYVWTVTNETDTYATQCFRYNTFTQAWTRWDKPQRAAVLNSSNNLLYLASPLTNAVDVERKSQTRRDYADGEMSLSIVANPILSATTFIVSSAQDVVAGDAIVQTQYLTVSQYNNLLLKLDSDPRIGLAPGTFDTSYYAALALADGADLTNGMTSLVAKLNADAGTDQGYLFSGTTNFVTIQTEYNALIAKMNLDLKLKFVNYSTSVGTSDIEMSVTAVNRNASTVTGDSVPAFLVGPITVFKGISASVVWAPSTFEDPALLKHVREATTMFESSSFRGGVVGYNTDLSPSFESVSFRMDGNGTWGGSTWGENTWGGGGLSVPLRTYIPRQKQRCRYIRSRFQHIDAFYKFSILGISYAFEVSSERAYRGK